MIGQTELTKILLGYTALVDLQTVARDDRARLLDDDTVRVALRSLGDDEMISVIHIDAPGTSTVTRS